MAVNLSDSQTPLKRDISDPMIAVCETHEAAQAIVETLHRAGWDMAKVSLN